MTEDEFWAELDDDANTADREAEDEDSMMTAPRWLDKVDIISTEQVGMETRSTRVQGRLTCSSVGQGDIGLRRRRTSNYTAEVAARRSRKKNPKRCDRGKGYENRPL